MDKHEIELMRRRAREKAAFLYSRALERGDFETVAAVLAQAEDDPELERILVGVNETLEDEFEAAEAAGDAAQIGILVREHIPSGFAPDPADDAELPPLTIADVVRHMAEDAAQHGHTTAEIVSFAQQLGQIERTLPEELTLGSIRQILSELGVAASATIVKIFRETAIYLAQGREHGEAYRAAARHQRTPRPKRDTRTAGHEPDEEEEERP